MRGNEYQELAARTVNHHLDYKSMVNHALFGMCGEIGELQSIYQKEYQGHEFDEEHAKRN